MLNGEYKQGLINWLGTQSSEQVKALVDVLVEYRMASPYSSGAAARAINIIRMPTSEFYVNNAPTYVDVNGLIPIYQKLAFRENLLVEGPKGDGKTLSVVTYAHLEQCPLVVVECSEATKALDLIGSFVLQGNETSFTLGRLPTAVDIANEVGKCILLFEEMNALTPQVQKMLNALLDFRRFVTVPALGRTYRLREGAQLWICGTMNPSCYGGTYDLNEDLKSRMEEIEVGYPPHGQEKQILKAVCGDTVDPQNRQITDEVLEQCLRFANQTRQQVSEYALSTRDLVRLVRNAGRLGLQTAVQLIVCKFQQGEGRDLIIKAAERTFPNLHLAKYWGAQPVNAQPNAGPARPNPGVAVTP